LKPKKEKTMNRPNDIVMVFGNPAKLEHPIDQAKLIKCISDCVNLEEWVVEYLNDEGQFYNVLIKKDDGENKT